MIEVRAASRGIIDVDSHVIEPWDLWSRSIAGPFKAAAPKAAEDSWGVRRLMVESRLFPTPEGPGRAPRRILSEQEQASYQERLAISQDPKARLAMMDAQGIVKSVLMPSQGLVIGAIRDEELASVVAQVYNDWLAEYCAAAPDRLAGAALLGLQSPRQALKELARTYDRYGMRAVVVKPNPVARRNLNDPAYYPIYEACEAYGITVLIHEGCGYAPDATLGIDRFENGLISHLLSHPFEQMMAVVAFILGGVLERFPQLRVGFLEAGCGWVPYWLERMDEHAEKLSWEVPWLTMAPSAYFRRQCIVASEPDEAIPEPLLSHFPGNVVFGSDFPHSDQLELQEPAKANCFKSLTDAQREAVMATNAERFLTPMPARP